LTLDDFPTLRHVLKYLLTQKSSAAATASQPDSSDFAKSNSPPLEIPAVSKRVNAPGEAELPSQSHFNEGFHRGQASKLAIRSAINRRAQTAIASREGAQNVDRLANQLLPAETAELDGIADGAGILAESLRAFNFAGQTLAPAETEFSSDGSLVLRGFCLGETAPLIVASASRQGGNCFEWIVPGCLGCLAGLSEHGFAISVRLPANSLLSNQLPATIIARRVLRDCVNMDEAQALLDASCWNPGAVIALADLAASTVIHWTTDAMGKPRRATTAVIPTGIKKSLPLD
jgi:hypothetical protein